MRDLARKPGALLLVAAFLAVTFCLSLFEITEHDYWWHLATGKYILEHGTVPTEDVFSFTATKPWVAHYWLADVIGYALYLLVGTPGMILLNALLIASAFWLVLRATLARGSGLITGVVLVLLAVYASRSRFYVRPETVSFLFLALYIALFERWRRRGGALPLIILPLLQLLWVNLYGGGSVVGLVLLFCFTGGELLNFLFPLRGRQRRGGRDVAALAVSALAAFSLSFVNPNTHRTVFYFLMSRDPVFRHIVEWRHMEAKDLLGLHGLFLFLGAFLLVRFWRSTDFTDLALFAVFGYMSVDAPRSLPFFVMAAAPAMGWRLREAFSPMARWMGLDRMSSRGRFWSAAGCALAMAAFTLWFLCKDIGKFHRDYAFGLDINKKLFPIQSVDFIEEHAIAGPFFNSYGIGGYLIWRLFPEWKVFVDGRVEMYGTDFLKEYMIYWHPEVWNGYVRKYGLNCAIVDREPTYTTRYLDDSPEWVLVFFDDRAMVYLRNVPANADLVKQFGYRYLRPGSLQFEYLDGYLKDPVAAGSVIGELKRSFHDEVYNLNAHLMLGYCYARMGGPYLPLALEEYRAALKLMPEGGDIRKKIAWLEGIRAERL